VWTRLGLSAAPPGWTEDERSGARVLVVSACAPLASRGPRWLAERLLRLAATRWAAILAQELRSAPEEVWQRALGERYESVSRRYALRTRRSSGGLGSVLAIDERTFEAVRAGLARWLAAGPDPAVLTTELEAAFAGTRTPGRLA
jgi:hypothetical protein